MPILKAYAPQHYVLDEISKRLGLEEPIEISVRRATGGDVAKFQAKFSSFKTIVTQDGVRLESDAYSNYIMQLYAIYLTLSGCNIEVEEPDGSVRPLFEFSNGRIRGTFERFVERIGLLDTDIAAAIYEKVVEANPIWGPEGEAYEKKE